MKNSELKTFVAHSLECLTKFYLAQSAQGSITVARHSLPSIMFALQGKQATTADKWFIRTLAKNTNTNTVKVI